jgi:signal transduction histidine kinase
LLVFCIGLLMKNTKKFLQDIFLIRSNPFINDKLLEKEYYNHIYYLDFDRLRIFSYFLLPFSIILLYTDFYLTGLWQQRQISLFVQLDIILAINSLFVFYFTNFRRPKSPERVKSWMVYFIYYYVFIHLMWASAITIIEESTANSLPTYLLGVYSIVLLFIINGIYLFIMLFMSLGFLIIGLYLADKDVSEVVSHYYYTIVLIVLALIISRVLSKTRLKTFLATKELENAKNTLDKKVKERTSELQLTNEQLTNEINERKKYEKILEREKKKAQEADNLKSLFLANMSHEIRTPLNGILGFSDLLYKQNIPQSKINRYLDIIHNNGQQLLKIIDDILDISMIASNQLTINKVNFRLSYIFPDAVEFFNRQKKLDNKESIEIIYNPAKDDSDDYIYSDPIRIQQILNNLLHNSIKFTDSGFIKFGGKIEGGYALIYLEDSGIGVSFQHRKSIFKRFRQGDESSNRVYGGTGLGLSISKGIIELLGGMIWHDSTYSMGARFCFSIPVNIGDNPEILPNQHKYFEALRKKRILLIENEYHEYSFLAESFKELKIVNYRTEFDKITADISDYHPDLIILDISELEPNLAEIFSQVKLYSNGSKIFSILPDKQDADINFIQANCDRVFKRPLNIQHLFAESLNAFSNNSTGQQV